MSSLLLPADGNDSTLTVHSDVMQGVIVALKPGRPKPRYEVAPDDRAPLARAILEGSPYVVVNRADVREVVDELKGADSLVRWTRRRLRAALGEGS